MMKWLATIVDSPWFPMTAGILAIVALGVAIVWGCVLADSAIDDAMDWEKDFPNEDVS